MEKKELKDKESELAELLTDSLIRLSKDLFSENALSSINDDDLSVLQFKLKLFDSLGKVIKKGDFVDD